MNAARTLGLLLCLAPLTALGCAVEPADDADPVASESALTSLPVGRYAVADEPRSGTYVSELTIAAGKRVELEWVRVRTTYEPWFFNPWVRVPVTKTQRLALTGTYSVFPGSSGETLVSFDVTNRGLDHLIYAIERTTSGGLALKAVGGSRFELRPTTAAPRATDARVLDCKGRQWDAIITLDEAQRRRGTMTVTRRAGASRTDPPNGSFTVAYDGDTGVADYMRYEGYDRQGNGYDFALKRSDLEKTSGPITQVGLGYTPDLSPGAWHNTLACTISRP
ncbi:MAG: hypothetical protein KF819_10450 [Labilithrix sp.]|nr:hypothetical protein [Labilithrix sp.]